MLDFLMYDEVERNKARIAEVEVNNSLAESREAAYIVAQTTVNRVTHLQSQQFTLSSTLWDHETKMMIKDLGDHKVSDFTKEYLGKKISDDLLLYFKTVGGIDNEFREHGFDDIPKGFVDKFKEFFKEINRDILEYSGEVAMSYLGIYFRDEEFLKESKAKIESLEKKIKTRFEDFLKLCADYKPTAEDYTEAGKDAGADGLLNLIFGFDKMKKGETKNESTDGNA